MPWFLVVMLAKNLLRPSRTNNFARYFPTNFEFNFSKSNSDYSAHQYLEFDSLLNDPNTSGCVEVYHESNPIQPIATFLHLHI